MALPSSGAISLNSLQTEYGGSNPISINEYYRGGSLVPNTTPNNSIPTSGAINLNNFYGGIAFYGIRDDSLEIVDFTGPLSVSWGIDLSSGEVRLVRRSISTYNWLRTASNSPSDYQIRATYISGNATPSGTYDTWLSLGTSREWTLTRNNVGTSVATVQFQIRLTATQVVFSTASVNFSVEFTTNN